MLSIYQRQLNLFYAGYYYKGKLDGIEGPLTKEAYKDFQKEQKLEADGIYGVQTEAALIEYVKDMQRQLNNAGANIKVDGIVGTCTISAIKSFQKKYGLEVDGIIGENTIKKLYNNANVQKSDELEWSKFKYFKRDEFKCPCGHCDGFPVEPNLKLVSLLERAREYFGMPIIITSGIRCAYQNKKVGGINNSKHKVGKAADCSLNNSSANDQKLLKWFKKQPEISYTYTGFGAVHVDIK